MLFKNLKIRSYDEKVGLLFVSISALLLGACGNSTASEDGKLNIVTTFYPVYEFTKQVAGDEANVDLLVKAGTEVHDYEPSAKDIARIQEADVLFTKMKIWKHGFMMLRNLLTPQRSV